MFVFSRLLLIQLFFLCAISMVRKKQEMLAIFLLAGTSGTHWWVTHAHKSKHTDAIFSRSSVVTVFAVCLQVGNSQYYNYSLSVNGKEEPHSDSYEKDYLTDLIVSNHHSLVTAVTPAETHNETITWGFMGRNATVHLQLGWVSGCHRNVTWSLLANQQWGRLISNH